MAPRKILPLKFILVDLPNQYFSDKIKKEQYLTKVRKVSFRRSSAFASHLYDTFGSCILDTKCG